MLEQIVEEMAFWFDEIKKRYLEKETEVERKQKQNMKEMEFK